MTNTELEVYTQKKEFEYNIIHTVQNFEAVSISVEREVQNIYFLLQSSHENAFVKFTAEIAPHKCHHDDCENETMLHHIVKTVVDFLIIDGILMLSVAAFFYFFGFNQKLV